MTRKHRRIFNLSRSSKVKFDDANRKAMDTSYGTYVESNIVAVKIFNLYEHYTRTRADPQTDDRKT